jgi:hypothetical protein
VSDPEAPPRAPTLTLRESGIDHLDDGTEAVNVGPIVAALRFLTEGRGDDRGVDETGAPQPDLLSLAFEVVRSIIVGGRHADYFRQVKLDYDARLDGGTSLGLARRAERHTAPTAALKKATHDLQGRLRKLEQAAALVMTEVEALTAPPPERRKRARKAKPKARPVAAPPPPPPPKPRKKAKPKAVPAPARGAPKKTRKKTRRGASTR